MKYDNDEKLRLESIPWVLLINLQPLLGKKINKIYFFSNYLFVLYGNGVLHLWGPNSWSFYYPALLKFMYAVHCHYSTTQFVQLPTTLIANY